MPHITDPHLTGHIHALESIDTVQLIRWGQHLARVLTTGGRLLIAGNGGSAAEAQHLSAELVGRYRLDRQPLAAIALHADTSTMTALSNDFGYEEVFARQVRAHGQAGDILLVMTTSGRSTNVLAAVEQARTQGLTTWALTGPGPNPTTDACDESLPIAGSTPHVQECHLVAVHLLAATVDTEIAQASAPVTTSAAGADTTPARQPRTNDLVRGRSCRLVIVGDVLVDETLEGEVHRISPEAPVPVVDRPRRDLHPGGAGLAALLAAGDGHTVTLITALSDEPADVLMTDILRGAGITVVNLGTPTPAATKTRVRAGGHTLLMLDHAASPAPPGQLTDEGRRALREASAILVSDYGRGITASDDIRAQLTALAARIPVVWDPHPHGSAPVPGVSVATPNRREAAHFAAGVPGDDLASDVARARQLAVLWNARAVAVTLGSRGAAQVDATGGAPLVVPPLQAAAGDACGAGDRFAGVLTVCLGAGDLPAQALTTAVHAAAGFVAGRAARTPVSAAMATTGGLQLAALTQAQGGTVVATGGCFDLLHRGHITLLQQARALGDLLIVCVNSDTSVTRLKGAARPLVPAHDRVTVLEALTCVDAVVIFDEDTPCETLAQLRPDIWVKGGDYAGENLPERAVIEGHGGQVVLLPYLDGHSTTSLISRASTSILAAVASA